MSIAIRLTLFSVLSIGSAYVVDTYGFALAHSLGLGVLAFILSPGIIMVFFHGNFSVILSWAFFVVINILYYEAICRLFLRIHDSPRE